MTQEQDTGAAVPEQQPAVHEDRSNTIGKLAEALAAAQGKFPKIERNSEVTVKTKKGYSYAFKYATLDHIREKVTPALAANGLALIQRLAPDADGATRLRTMLAHKTGEWIESVAPLVKGDESGPKAFGSALTYMRRYAVCALLGIVADEDDDAGGAEGDETRPAGSRFDGDSGHGTGYDDWQKNPITEPQRKRLYAIATNAGWDHDQMKDLLAAYNFESSRDVTRGLYDAICAWVEKQAPGVIPGDLVGPKPDEQPDAHDQGAERPGEGDLEPGERDDGETPF